MNLSIIAAIGENNELGLRNKLLWHIPADLKRFKALTSGHTVVMGRITFESINSKPLPNRRNIIISRSGIPATPGIIIISTMDELFEILNFNEETFILGGGMIYELLLPYADKMYLTIVHKTYSADTFFPVFDRSHWKITEQTVIEDDPVAGVSYSFINYSRVSK
jgi:dihydrofolate reductase